ncbi:MAG: TfoX/Sxy family protein [Flavobacteriaceae bacterium]
MAYDDYLADRIKNTLKERKVAFQEKKMMGGLCFMVDDKMLCGTHIDKKYGDSLLMARIGESFYEEALTMKGCLPMDFTGRPMKGFVFITPEGFDTDSELAFWVQKCLDFNPLAKASKKRKK